ncbi:MAG: Na/Pi cotransporter family protein [Bacteroidaceae bacterium]|nr:Na/Pi cotransporter family protein [Prevotellaceae bacterium]MDY2849123.1 Na/Pi cotransporter family protein [Bacteroidaceae bacterium]
MQTFVNIFSLLGSLGLFLYGMKIMSEGLEKFAGDRLRNILAAMTKNRVMGVLTGISVTALIQSSSATTVMVISFVNAGLMTLTQAIGVIMGANVGTTVTAWIISAIGFKVNVAAFALPLLAIGIPLVFSGNSQRKSIGEFVFGFSFLFMGLSFLQESAENLQVGNVVALMLAKVADGGFFTIILFVIVGALVTMLVQASAATMAITLMLFDMNIPGFGLEQAAALAMGQNIGTTITAFIASLTGNTQARRAALAHMFFNVFGVIIVLFIFYPFCDAITWFVSNVLGTPDNDMFKLSAFHTAFNVFNTLILIWFVKQIEQFVCKVLPQKEEKEEPRLRFISGGLLSTAELSIIQARNEIGVMAERCCRMTDMVRKALSAKKDNEFENLYNRIEHYEQITDNMETEIADYLRKVSEGRLSAYTKMHIAQMLREVDELESVGDSMYHLARTLSRKRQHEPSPFTNEQKAHMEEMLNLTDKALGNMHSILLDNTSDPVDLKNAYGMESQLNDFRSKCRDENLEAVNTGVYNYRLGTFYNDFIGECERIGDYVINVVQAENEARQPVE